MFVGNGSGVEVAVGSSVNVAEGVILGGTAVSVEAVVGTGSGVDVACGDAGASPAAQLASKNTAAHNAASRGNIKVLIISSFRFSRYAAASHPSTDQRFAYCQRGS